MMADLVVLCQKRDWETRCQVRADGVHCNCWYDGEVCCACGDQAGPIVFSDDYAEWKARNAKKEKEKAE